MQKSKIQSISLYLLLGVLIALSAARYERFAAKRHFGDFHVYYETGGKLLRGESIYTDSGGELTPFKYSPLAASWFALLARFKEPAAAGIWHVLNLFFLFASVSIGTDLAARCFGRRRLLQKEKWLLAALSIGIVSSPILHCLNSGQVGCAILFFFTAGVYFGADKRRDILSAFFFALSAMFKYLPVLALPYFLFKKSIKLAVWFCIWFIVLHLVPAAWLGFERNLSYLQNYVPFLTSTTLDHVSMLDFKNQSAWAYLYRLWYYDIGFFEVRDHPIYLAAAGGVMFCLLFAAALFSRSAKEDAGFVVDGALLSILIVVFNPNAWKHNFTMLLFPISVLVLAAFYQKWKNWKTVLLAGIFLLFLASNRDLIGWNVRYDLLSLSVMFLASLLLFIALVFTKRELR